MIPRQFFDRPIWTDPLFWFGIVVGLSVSIVVGLHRDLPVADFIWYVFAPTFAFTWWTADLILSTIRHQFRRRRATKQPEAEVAAD
ncbi:hypothetical protein ACIBG5_43560 [Kribbella sp. NPDC050241]|uniref:hypothetical protein n=1 Tax=Kribbella sp. NPDC050241 TaxID=3364115 RepID=UPI0037AF58E1